MTGRQQIIGDLLHRSFKDPITEQKKNIYETEIRNEQSRNYYVMTQPGQTWPNLKNAEESCNSEDHQESSLVKHPSNGQRGIGQPTFCSPNFAKHRLTKTKMRPSRMSGERQGTLQPTY